MDKSHEYKINGMDLRTREARQLANSLVSNRMRTTYQENHGLRNKLAQKTWESLRDSNKRKLKVRSETQCSQVPDISEAKWPTYSSMDDFVKDMPAPRKGTGNPSSANKSLSKYAKQAREAREARVNREAREKIVEVVEEHPMEDVQTSDSQESSIHDSQKYTDIGIPSLKNSKEKQPVQSPGFCETVRNSTKLTKETQPEAKPAKKVSIVEPETLALDNIILQLPEECTPVASKKEDDEDYMFLMSLLPSIKQLDTLEKMRLKMGFMEIITREMEKKKLRETVQLTREIAANGGLSQSVVITSPSSSQQSVKLGNETYIPQRILLQHPPVTIPERPEEMDPKGASATENKS